MFNFLTKIISIFFILFLIFNLVSCSPETKEDSIFFDIERILNGEKVLDGEQLTDIFRINDKDDNNT